jgi:hypothetical protein
MTSGIGILLLLNSCQSSNSGPDVETLFEERCSVCHKTDVPKSVRKTKSEWDSTVTRMITKGAKLSPEEKTALVRYLSRLYKP